MKKKIPIVAYLEEAHTSWLDKKREQGYNKSSIIRLLINECMSREETNAHPVRVKDWKKDKEEHVTFPEIISVPIKETHETKVNPEVKKVETRTKENSEIIKRSKWFPIDIKNTDIEDAIADMVAKNDTSNPDLEDYKAVDWCFKNMKHISTETAFLLGMFKGNMLQNLARDDALDEQS
jgi:hypothetical protein